MGLTLFCLLLMNSYAVAVQPMVTAGGDFTIALKSDGTVVPVEWGNDTWEPISQWSDIIQVAAGTNHVAGLKPNGTAVSAGDDFFWSLSIG